MPNPENIEKHKFKKGQSGNPKGRPKKLPELDKLLDDVLGGDDKNISEAEKILDALRKKALQGDTRAAEILLDRAYGKAKQSIDHTSKGESIARPDLTKLTDDELRAIANLQRKSGVSE